MLCLDWDEPGVLVIRRMGKQGNSIVGGIMHVMAPFWVFPTIYAECSICS